MLWSVNAVTELTVIRTAKFSSFIEAAFVNLPSMALIVSRYLMSKWKAKKRNNAHESPDCASAQHNATA